MTLPFRKLKSDVRNSAWRWGPGVVAAIITLSGAEAGIFQSFQALTYNILFRLRGSVAWDERVVVVEIDDQSIQDIGQFPIARSYYTEFLNRLEEAQPSVVAFDIVFAEASEDDVALGEAMNRLNRVVLAQSWDNQGLPILPNPTLADHAVSMGHVLNPPTDDGISRTIRPYIQGVPALGIAIAQSYSLVAAAIAIPSDYQTHTQAFWINWPGFAQDCPSYSFVEVLRGEVPAERFQNKIVIVGVTASGNSPLFTPFNRTPPIGGVYLQAAVVSNLLQQNNLYKMGMVWQILILVLGGPVLSVLSSYRGCRRRWISWLGCCVGWNLLGLLFLKANILLPLFWPVILVTVTTGLTESIERLRANRRLQKEIERLWDTYNPDLIRWRRPSVDTISSQPTHPPSEGNSSEFGLRLGLSRPPITTQPIAVQRAMQLAQLAELFGRSQSLHAAIARSLSVGLIAADWDGRVWLCNPFAEVLVNLQVGESLQSKLIPTWVSAEEWNHHILQLSESGSTGWEIHHQEAWFEIKLESLFYDRQPGHIVGDRSTSPALKPQQPTGLLVLIQDITSFKHVEAGIRSALAEALELSELKSRFVSMASHEIRTPLTIMRTSVELLKLYGLNIPLEKHTKYLAKMETSINNMQKLVDDVLILGKSGTQRLSLKPQLLNLAIFCQDLIDQLQPADASERRIHLALSLDREQFMFDSTVLSLILNNLLSNALKYSPANSPVHLNVVSSEGGVTFEVRDRGIGMPIDYQSHLFEEFHRAKNVGTIPGTGLGLSIVKRCVDLHGGTISLDSDVGGVGTTFRVSFPHPLR